jgi:hypothetical protein
MSFRATSQCRSCGAPIFWAVTERGAKIPMNPAPTEQGFVITAPKKGGPPLAENRFAQLGEHYYTSHFATCRDAKQWSGL